VNQTARRGEKEAVSHKKMSMIDHTLNKYDILFRAYLDLLPLNLVYFVLGNIISLAVGMAPASKSGNLHYYYYHLVLLF